jgi:phenylalanyl-tRNA synthetase alpha chain
MLERIQHLLEEVDKLKANNAEELEALRIKYLSKKGEINSLMADFRNVAADQKREVGQKLNELKNKAQDRINELKSNLNTAQSTEENLDLTRTPYPIKLGTRHPLSIVKTKYVTYLLDWDSPWRKDLRLKMIGMYFLQ